ncbi:hypothetical protein K4H61_13160, partial [Clostridium chauvoei]|nr:hypothetical protein [Clostridium chauvoei]MBX7420402.1 hypothetical protein [Clostridium chauvoei]
MRKYLNRSIFYQGDANIILPLVACYIGAFIFQSTIINKWFGYLKYQVLYTTTEKYLSSSNDIFILLLLVLYLSIIYMISVGIFKRKKWSTLLSGPFSKKDIRRRELILVIMSTMVFFIIYYILIISGYIRNSELISYLNVFNNVIILDFIRMFSISILVIGGLFFLDSLFSNLYMLIFSVVFIGIYSITLILNIEFLFNYYIR